jgi:hypothetical protein
MGYSGSTDSIAATATAAYDVDALLSDAKGERLGVDPRKLAQFVRLLQGGRATAGNGFNGDVDGDPDDPQGAGTQTLRCACMRTFIEISSLYIHSIVCYNNSLVQLAMSQHVCNASSALGILLFTHCYDGLEHNMLSV